MRQAEEVQEARTTVQERRWAFPSVVGIVSTAIGAALVVIGIIVLLRGDVSGSWDRPVVQVAGLTHTPLLGAIEIAAGALIAFAGLMNSRGSVLFCATALAVFGAVVVIQPDQLHERLAVTRTHGWWSIAIAAALTLAALLTPVAGGRVVRRRRVPIVDGPMVDGTDIAP